jgi:hypothetical protein
VDRSGKGIIKVKEQVDPTKKIDQSPKWNFKKNDKFPKHPCGNDFREVKLGYYPSTLCIFNKSVKVAREGN